VIVGVISEQPVARLKDVPVVLDQPFRTGVRFVDLALGAIFCQEPVLSQCLSVLLFRDPDAFCCLLLESLQLPGPNGQVCEDFKCHTSSFRSKMSLKSALRLARKGPNKLGLVASENLLC
jgi:hypothetical protein